ncbi:hypothetical protein AAHA92_23812 [Salvia divinorum]|uniref:Uncharacterized protein n=1 Tax=Salvia divinorum TaxID=28513 RepID=A0ABD1GT56_SALDI
MKGQECKKAVIEGLEEHLLSNPRENRKQKGGVGGVGCCSVVFFTVALESGVGSLGLRVNIFLKKKQWRVSKQVFPLTPVEQQAVRGVRRKLDADSSSTEHCSFKRRRDAQCHPSPFERPFTTVGPICSPIGDGMDTN